MTAPIEDNELREQLIDLDGELWDYQLDKLVTFINAHTARKETEARLEVVKSANCILQADEPSIDEIWFDLKFPNGEVWPMRQDTMISELEQKLKQS